jgi:hypothetical protein
LGSAATTISGWDAGILGIKYDELDFGGFTDVIDCHLKTYTMETVILALHDEKGNLHLEPLNEVDVMQPEEGMTGDNHLPSLIGIDILRRYVLRPRLNYCSLEKETETD